MKELTKGQAVRTNNKWRAFFKTGEVIRGMVTGLWYDHDTAIVRDDKGNEIKIHKDWLELDDKKMRDKR